MESDCQFHIALAIDQLEKWRYGKEMMRYVKTNIDLRLQKANLGKFLFNFRERLSIDDIEHIIYQHYLIQYFKAWQRESDKEAVLRQMPAEELDTAGNDSVITLPNMFTDLLSENERAVRLFIQLLGQVESKVNISPSKGEDGVIEGKSSVDGFKWPHVMQAFIDLEFIPANTPKVEFGRFIHSLFSNRTVASVTRDLYRAHESTFARIVSDIKKKFKPVYDIIHAHD